MSTHIPGGEVTMHPGPKKAENGIKAEHGSHDVKGGYGGNDVIMRGGPPVLKKTTPLGQHNTMVQDQPGNTVQMSRTVARETGAASDDEHESLLEPPTLPPVEDKIGEYAEMLARVSAHSREEMERIAQNMELSFVEGIDDDELANLITETIILTEEAGEEDEDNEAGV